MSERRLYRRLGDPARSGAEKFLGDLEGDIMELLWQRGRMSVRMVLDALNVGRAHPIAYTTALTVMQRLAEKGLLDRALVGNTHFYTARQSREDFLAEASGRVVRALVAEFGDMAIAQFLAELGRLDPERLRRLRARAGLEDPPDGAA